MREFNDADSEGRVITTAFNNFVVVNCYVPNGASRLSFKLDFMTRLVGYLTELDSKFNNVILCGDMNIAHKEMDVNKPKRVCKKIGVSCRGTAIFG